MNMVKLLLKEVKERASKRPEVNLEEFLSKGRIDGPWFYIENSIYLEYLNRYRPKAKGLGDVVASVAQPIAKGIDAVFGTNVQGCGACKKRQEALNNLVPFSTGSV